MLHLVEASEGRAFLLFSSKRMLDIVHGKIAHLIEHPVLKQGEMPRPALTQAFKRHGDAVLFALKSYWEGVDIVGEALSLVVIDKLPFSAPDDPVHEARVNQMKARGENWFMDMVIPEVTILLKQGVGRLIRSHEDRGVMAILDVRLHTKPYGRTVLADLPPARRVTRIEEVRQFYHRLAERKAS